MLKIGLTGGIGCGKTTVAHLFADLDAPVLDADLIARELVEPGQPALALIAQTFGGDIIVNGRLDRDHLRERVFASPEERRKLEAILHPLVFQTMQARLQSIATPYCILAIPLLLESGQRSFVDRILVIDCPEPLQIRRVTERDGLAADMVKTIMAAQTSRAERLACADDVIVNDGSLAQLRDQVEQLHRQYLRQAID